MPKPFFKPNKLAIDRIIRVDHAGEFGAQRIYQGQINHTKDPKERQLIKHMLEQEEEHLSFNNQIHAYQVRPTILMPFWHRFGYLLGAISAKVSPKTAMLVTEKVEEVIEEHYNEQIALLRKTAPEHKLIRYLEKFRDDEVNHKNIAINHDSRLALFAPIFAGIIQNICKIAIFLSKKI